MSKVFISHAGEDKETVAIPLAQLLKQRGIEVWLDEWELTVGDSLRRKIEKAISEASFGIVIVSPAYMRKTWPARELDGLFALETAGRKLILPVLHNIREDEIRRVWPMLADKLSCSTDRGIDAVANQITIAIEKGSTETPVEQPSNAVLSEYRRRMLLAANARDLRTIRYELEDFLRRYPAHPQGLLLRDDMMRALRYEEQPVCCAPAPRAYRRPIWITIGTLALLGGALYLVFKLIKHLLGF